MSLNIHRIGMSVKECLVPYVLEGSSDILEVMMGLENSYPGITNADQLKTHTKINRLSLKISFSRK